MKTKTDIAEPKWDPYSIVICVITLMVPVLVLPNILDNAFNTPKTFLLIISACLMVGIYCIQFLRGRAVQKAETSTTGIMLFLVLLNFFSFFYTGNYYYTVVAATMNTTCLLIFFFVSNYVDNDKAFILVILAALSGLLVSIITWLQYHNIFFLF